eukprot:TRINITY_DN6546_c0_g1_i2.p1 TRINITY_DN6546_c0_g1~~TRINITY_DN6546_c0_g1_i2.p1  ORF type:complete len:218 (-),score=22.71 TRINITY_DN6546_c0_g1_i2:174-827(-)
MFPQRNFHYITHFKIGYEGADPVKVTEYQMRFPENSYRKSRSNEPAHNGNQDYYFQENHLHKSPEQPYALNEPISNYGLPELYEPGRLVERKPKHSTINRKSNSEAYRHLQTPYRKAATDPTVVKSSNREQEDIIESRQINQQVQPCSSIMIIDCIARKGDKEKYSNYAHAEDNKSPKPCPKLTNDDPPVAIMEKDHERERGNERAERYVSHYYLYS